jgi:hypothetical protein
MNRSIGGLAGEFAGTHLGDARRGRRFRTIVASLATRRAGKVSDVFRDAAERQGAYDFLEHDNVKAASVQIAAGRAIARRCAEFDSIYLALDGSSLTLTDEGEDKGFGSIGTRQKGARGLKVLNALAIAPTGQTIGALAQCFWARTEPAKKGYRPLVARESCRWHDALESAQLALAADARQTSMHVLADREGDASLLMQRIVDGGRAFTIRANGTRKALVEGRKVYIPRLLKRQKPIARHSVAVPAKDGQPARIATLTVRAAHVQLVVRDHHLQQRRLLSLSVVWGREEKAPRRAKRLDWMLYTTVEAHTASNAVDALIRYTYRWRIEEFHRTLKRGGGCVEDSQLRSSEAVIKWATLHSIVASRVQRLRDAARTTPDLPASVELSDAEIEALVLLKTQEKRRNETISTEGLSLQRAVRWIGDLGGFTATGKSEKMPGPMVLGRGLERVLDAAQIVQALRAAGKLR